MRSLLLMCTKSVHFTFDNETFVQVDGVAMGSPLGPVIAGIFMVELETYLVPTLGNCITFWRRYVDDTFCIINSGTKDFILSKLNNFHSQINFTSEEQTNNMIAFLDVLIINRFGNIDSTVYRKPTNTDVYINWNSFFPRNLEKEYTKNAHSTCLHDL